MTTTGWLRKASAARFELPLGVALGLALAFFLFAMPEPLFDGYFAATALPLLGFPGRVIAAVGFGALIGWATWRGLAAAGPSRDHWKLDIDQQRFIPRRADAHPDAPPRRPIFAASDLGAPMDEAPQLKPRNRNPVRASEAAPAPLPAPAPADVPVAAEPEAAAPSAMGPSPAELLAESIAAPKMPSPPMAVAEEAPAEAPAARWTMEPQPAPAVEPAVVSPAPAPNEVESIAALMQRLEEGLARRPTAAPAADLVSSPAGTWLVRDEGEATRMVAGKR